MKRILPALALCALPALAQAQVTNPLTRVFVIPISGDCETTPCSIAGKQMCRETATATTAFMCNGSSGFYDIGISGGGVDAGSQLNLEGPTGDSYLVLDAATGFILLYLDGALRATITPRGVIEGACGSDLYAMELGTVCIDTLGRRISVGPSGPVVLTGSLP